MDKDDKTLLNYVNSREFTKEEFRLFKNHGVSGPNEQRLNDISFMKNKMKVQKVVDHRNDHKSNKS